MKIWNINEIPTISIIELHPGYLIYLNGTKFVAKRIKWFQKLIYGIKSLFFLNHVGIYDQDIDGNGLVHEQDYPGRFQTNRFNEEYIITHDDLYIGIPECDLSLRIKELRKDCEILASNDSVLNYSYGSFISFMLNSFTKKFFNKESWVTKEPNVGTCSQVTAMLYQKHFGLFLSKIWYKWYPCELAQSDEIEIRRLIY